MIMHMAHHKPGAREVRVEGEAPLKNVDRLLCIFSVELRLVVVAKKIKFIGFEASWRLTSEAPAFGAEDLTAPASQRAYDLFDDRILCVEQTSLLTRPPLRPEVGTSHGVNQLRSDTNLALGRLKAPLNHVPRTKRAANLPNIGMTMRIL